jgi:ubiquinone/menaquinone biosynthesis C-methylase UbiE
MHERKLPASKLAPETRGNTIRWARHYDLVVRLITLGKDRVLREWTAETAQVKPGDIVLDVGCGTGELTIAATARAGSAGKVYGIDASPEMIEVAHSKAQEQDIEIDFQVGLIEALIFPDNTFDVVLSSLMMHHLPEDVKHKGLSEIHRVLKPGGRLLVVDVKRPTSFYSLVVLASLLHTKIEAGVQDLPVLMQTAGFNAIEIGEVPAFPMFGFVRGEVGDS